MGIFRANPDGARLGRFWPAWLRWPAIAACLGLFGYLIALSFLQLESDWAVPAGFIFFAILLATGIIVLLLRYTRQMDLAAKHHAQLVVAALALQPFTLLVSFISSLGSSSAILILALAIFQILLPSLIPASLLAAVARRGLWSAQVGRLASQRGIVLAGSAFLVGLLAIAIYLLALRPPSPGRILFTPLPASDDPRPVIVDTDMAPDDWMALLYLL